MGDHPSIRLDRPIVLVGRSADCDVIIDSAKVSRKHCCIAQIDSYLVVRDLGSTNGISVNGRRIEESKLVLGDELAIGNVLYRVDKDSKGDEKRTPARPVPEPAAVSDSVIERMDEPVPLPETDHGGSEIIGAFENAQKSAQSKKKKLAETDSAGEYKLQIPDEVRLKPLSDSEAPYSR